MQEEYGATEAYRTNTFSNFNPMSFVIWPKLNRVSSSDVAPIIFSDNTHDVTMYLYMLLLKTESRESSAAHKE